MQRARYSRPMYACGPEYDEPACCAPEDEQYTGAYGTPYSDHYGSRPSIGKDACFTPLYFGTTSNDSNVVMDSILSV